MGKNRDLNAALEKYKGGGNDFFCLKEDKDTAVVRFLYDTKDINDLDWFVVHQVEINGKKRWVLCTEEGDCPLCAAGMRPQVKLFLQLFDEKEGKVCTWERGRDFVAKMGSLMNRYGSLIKRPYEVERNGKKGDTKTKYELYALDEDGKKLEDFPDKQQLVDGAYGFVLELTNDEMTDVVNGTYTVPKRGEQQPEKPVIPTRRESTRRHATGGNTDAAGTSGENVF